MSYAFKAEWRSTGIEWYEFDTEQGAIKARRDMLNGGYTITTPVVATESRAQRSD